MKKIVLGLTFILISLFSLSSLEARHGGRAFGLGFAGGLFGSALGNTFWGGPYVGYGPYYGGGYYYAPGYYYSPGYFW